MQRRGTGSGNANSPPSKTAMESAGW